MNGGGERKSGGDGHRPQELATGVPARLTVIVAVAVLLYLAAGRRPGSPAGLSLVEVFAVAVALVEGIRAVVIVRRRVRRRPVALIDRAGLQSGEAGAASGVVRTSPGTGRRERPASARGRKGAAMRMIERGARDAEFFREELVPYLTRYRSIEERELGELEFPTRPGLFGLRKRGAVRRNLQRIVNMIGGPGSRSGEAGRRGGARDAGLSQESKGARDE